MNSEQLQWKLVHFDRMTADELYEALMLRQRVFVVEQQCAFLEADGVDPYAWHLFGSLPVEVENIQPLLAAYLRIVPPGRRFEEPSIGRVVTAPEVRRKGLGRALMQEGIRRTRELYPGQAIKLSAQRYLEGFYGSLGFIINGEPYEEDGIPHINMVMAQKVVSSQ
ncbi:GNAT family N-acetyltransferase [bacterium]|nr:MAG: GNAT family N-acetyltransferase [bacterium]